MVVGGRGLVVRRGSVVSRLPQTLCRGRAFTFAMNIITDIPRTNLAVPRGGKA